MENKFWLSNVLLEDSFSYQNNLINGTKTVLKNLLIENGKIVDISEGQITSELTVVDANKALAIPSFTEKHIHLDKGYYGGKWNACTPFVSVFDRISEEEGFLEDFLPGTKDGAKKLLELITSTGVTHARVQCNIDPVVKYQNIERVIEALEDYNNRLTYDIVAFPQHGLLRSGSDVLMKDALRKGANIVGGLDPATIDNDIEKSLRRMMDIAVEFNSEVDIHLHEGGSLGMYTIRRLAALTEEAKWQGKVTISHGYCLGDASKEEIIDIAQLLSAQGISLATTSPIDVSCPPIPLLHENGVKVNIINDNINDHWSPFGSGDLLRRASRMAEKFGWIDEYSLTRALGFITDGLMPLDKDGKKKWPNIGDDANIVFIDASCSAEAIARIPSRKAVMFKGSIVSGSL